MRNEAKDLLRDVRAEAPSALDEFREFHPGRIHPAIAALADAQLVLARSYGASSWPQLAAAVKAIDAISHDDFEALREVSGATLWISPATAIGRATAGTRRWRMPPTPRSDG